MPRQRLTETDKLILQDARKLDKWLTADKLALVNPSEGPIQLPVKRDHSAPKKHRTGGSIELNAVDAMLEMRRELKRHNCHVPKVYALYLYLRRIVNA